MQPRDVFQNDLRFAIHDPLNLKANTCRRANLNDAKAKV